MHVGTFCAPAGLDVTEQASDIAPVNPPLGVIMMVDVDELPALIVANGLLLIAKDGFGVGAVWTL